MMSRYLFILLLVVGCATSRSVRQSTSDPGFSVMTYNIRLNTPSDGENAWPKRREFLASQIAFHQPKILGIQEGLPDQVDWLSENLKAYDFVGEGRLGGHAGEYSAIFYRSNELEVKRSGTFWLSDSPELVSTGWDAALPRICTWAEFKFIGSEVSFLAFNTHFDHVGAEARRKSSDLILQQLLALNPEGLPAIVMGDLNLTPESEPIRRFSDALVDVYEAATMRLGPAATFNSFQTDRVPTRRIDYIFVSPTIQVDRMATLTDYIDGRYASDHFPVLAWLALP